MPDGRNIGNNLMGNVLCLKQFCFSRVCILNVQISEWAQNLFAADEEFAERFPVSGEGGTTIAVSSTVLVFTKLRL